MQQCSFLFNWKKRQGCNNYYLRKMQLEQEIQGTADRKFGPPVTTPIEMPCEPASKLSWSFWGYEGGTPGAAGEFVRRLMN